MTPSTGRVKPRRTYDSSSRRDRARRTQAHIVDVARQLFLRDGYPATTVARVAAAAEVSAETIYKSFGGKPGLIRAIGRTGLAGVGSVPAEDRSDAMSARETDPRAILLKWAVLSTEVAPRTAPIMLLIRSAAATEPEMATVLDEMNDERRDRMAHNASGLAEKGPLRAGVSIDYVRDVLLAYTAPELYELLVLHQHWTVTQYGDFIHRGLVAELLDPAMNPVDAVITQTVDARKRHR